MSISEARRQLKLMEILAAESYQDTPLLSVLTHGFSAIVEAIAENKPYDGSLNSIRVSLMDLRAISVELMQNDLDNIGLEDLLISLRARGRKNAVDKAQEM